MPETTRPLADLCSAMLDDDHDAMDSSVDELLDAGWTHNEVIQHIAHWTAAWSTEDRPRRRGRPFDRPQPGRAGPAPHRRERASDMTPAECEQALANLDAQYGEAHICEMVPNSSHSPARKPARSMTATVRRSEADTAEALDILREQLGAEPVD